jgi:hypothetical protein
MAPATTSPRLSLDTELNARIVGSMSREENGAF